MEGNEEVMMAESDRMSQFFKQADANNDGRLNQEESNEFFRLMKESDQQKGAFCSTFEDGDRVNYEMYNSLSNEEGYTLEEFQEAFGPIMEHWARLVQQKAEADAA